MRNRFRALVIADAGLLRDGLCSLFTMEGNIEIAGVLDSVAAIEDLSLARDPQLVVLDVTASADSPDRDIASIRSRWPTVRVVALTLGAQPVINPERHRLLTQLPKSESGRKLIDIVHSLMEADHPQSGGATGQLAGKSKRNADGLSDREREVMKQIARGFRTREIAVQLSLSQKTIEKHRSNLMRKLGLRTATAVAAYAIAHGYVDTE